VLLLLGAEVRDTHGTLKRSDGIMNEQAKRLLMSQ
jgi:hypothetical protein